MGTAPPGLLSWQPRTLSPSQLHYEKLRKPTTRKHQHSRHSKANNVEVTVRRAHLAKWCSQSQRRFRDRENDKSKDGITNSLSLDPLNSPNRWKGSGLPELVHRKTQHHRYVCCAADNGALFSSTDLGCNGAYDSKGVSLSNSRCYVVNCVCSVDNSSFNSSVAVQIFLI